MQEVLSLAELKSCPGTESQSMSVHGCYQHKLERKRHTITFTRDKKTFEINFSNEFYIAVFQDWAVKQNLVSVRSRSTSRQLSNNLQIAADVLFCITFVSFFRNSRHSSGRWNTTLRANWVSTSCLQHSSVLCVQILGQDSHETAAEPSSLNNPLLFHSPLTQFSTALRV